MRSDRPVRAPTPFGGAKMKTAESMARPAGRVGRRDDWRSLDPQQGLRSECKDPPSNL